MGIKNQASIYLFEGPPGSGKTTQALRVVRHFESRGVPVALVGIDDNCPGRLDRGTRSIIDWQQHELIEEAISAHLTPNGGSIGFVGYDLTTGQRNKRRDVRVPGQEGVLIVDGVTALEAMLTVRNSRSALMQTRAFLVKPPEHVAEARRIRRDVLIKKLPPDEAQRRVVTQRGVLRDYYADLMRSRMSRVLESGDGSLLCSLGNGSRR